MYIRASFVIKRVRQPLPDSVICEYPVIYFLILGKHSCERMTVFNDQHGAYCENMGLFSV